MTHRSAARGRALVAQRRSSALPCSGTWSTSHPECSPSRKVDPLRLRDLAKVLWSPHDRPSPADEPRRKQRRRLRGHSASKHIGSNGGASNPPLSVSPTI